MPAYRAGEHHSQDLNGGLAGSIEIPWCSSIVTNVDLNSRPNGHSLIANGDVAAELESDG